MKRFFAVVGAIVLCSSLAGCGSDTHEGLVSDTINMLNRATAEIKNTKNRVKDAAKTSKDTGKKIDLSDAFKAADQLKAVSDEIMMRDGLKAKIERARSKITDEDKQKYTANQQTTLNAAFADLLKERNELRIQLLEASKVGADAVLAANSAEVEKLRAKIQEAESPFEALSRN